MTRQDGAGPPRRLVAEESARETREDWLSEQLRQLYRGTLDEPIPDRFLRLLAELDEEAAATAGGPASEGGNGPAGETG